MKKTLSIILAILMIVTTIPMAFAADVVASGTFGVEGDNLTWTLDADGTLTISGTGEMGIQGEPDPNEEDYPWYDYAQSITAVVIESGITTLSRAAFYECGNLASVLLPDTLTYIDDFVFTRCNSLKSISIPYGVTGIDWNAFRQCAGLETIVLPSTVTYIHSYVFEGSNLSTVHYLGTTEQWEALSIPDGNDELKNATRHYCEEKAEMPATCTANGLTKGWYCATCKEDIVVQEVVPATNHKGTLVQVDAKAPTCTEIGWEAYEYCTVCDYTTLVEVPALGHINEDGNTTCDRCDEILLCEDCGRPVHDDSLMENIICWFTMLINLLKSMF